MAPSDFDRRRRDITAKLLQSPGWNVILVAVGLVGTISAVNQWKSNGDLKALGWPVAGVLAFILLFNLTTGILRRLAQTQRAGVRSSMANYLLLVPSSGNESFYVDWVFLLLRQAQTGGHSNVFITTEFAPESFKSDPENRRTESALEQLENLKRFGDAHFDGVFVMVDDPDDDRTRRQLLRYYRVFDSNLVLLDMNMNPRQDSTRGYPLMDFVGSDESLGGKLAAKLAFDYLTKIAPSSRVPRILILEPHDRAADDPAWDHRRIREFKESLNHRFNCHRLSSSTEGETEVAQHPPVFVSIGDCKYNQEKTKHLLQIPPNDTSVAEFLSSFDLIFASNDDTALGALDVVREHLEIDEFAFTESDLHHGHFRHRGPRIIGYDGAKTFLSVLNEGESNQWLLGTVDVQQHEQARIALDQMEKLKKAPTWRKSVSLRSASGYKNRLADYMLNRRHQEASDGENAFESHPLQTRYLERPRLIKPVMKIAPFLYNQLVIQGDQCCGPCYSVVHPSDLI